MSKNVADLRFAVSDPVLGHSNTWRLWITRHGDIYLSVRSTAGIEKFSFHRSGICRHAFTKEFGTPASMADRLIHRWIRPAIPEPNSNQFARLAWIAFPSDYLSAGPDKHSSKVTTFPASASGGATFVEVGLTLDSKERILDAAGNTTPWGLLFYATVFDNVAAFARWYHGDWQNNDLRMPASHGLPGYRFLAKEGIVASRPIRILLYSLAEDGGALLVTELGGCRDSAQEDMHGMPVPVG